MALLSVKSGVSGWNVFGMIMVLGTDMIATTYIFFSSVYFLQAKQYFGMDPDKAAATLSELLFFSQPLALCFDVSAGFFYAVFGRRWTIFVGFCFMSFGVAAIPWVSVQVYPHLFIMVNLMMFSHRLIYNNPLIPDYIKPKSRGLATAFVNVSSSVGSFISVMFLFGEMKNVSFQISSLVVGLIVIFIALVLLFAIRDRVRPIDQELLEVDS